MLAALALGLQRDRARIGSPAGVAVGTCSAVVSKVEAGVLDAGAAPPSQASNAAAASAVIRPIATIYRIASRTMQPFVPDKSSFAARAASRPCTFRLARPREPHALSSRSIWTVRTTNCLGLTVSRLAGLLCGANQTLRQSFQVVPPMGSGVPRISASHAAA